MSTVLPAGESTLTVRIIKSFEYRTVKPMIVRQIDLNKCTLAQLFSHVREQLDTGSMWKPFRSHIYDTIKLYVQRHGAKTNNLVINLDRNDEHLLTVETHGSKTLAELGCEHETELSAFSKSEYISYRDHPETKWE